MCSHPFFSKMTLQMTQDDILKNTKTVTQSLETLKQEHNSLLNQLVERLDTLKNDVNSRTIMNEEIAIIKNSNEMVQLGITEGSVSSFALNLIHAHT